MKHIPKRYLKANHLSQALLNIRRCLAAGLTVEQIAQEITENYPVANPNNQASMGVLLTSVYDFAESDSEYDTGSIARKCAEMFRAVFPLGMNPRRSISYEIYRTYCPIGQDLPWMERYSEKVIRWEGIERYRDNPYLWRIINDKARDCILTLCKDADLYCYVDENMTVNLFVLENSYYDEITIEEESENKKKPPYYRVEVNYFKSPVYKVRVAKKILDYCLQRIGYPKVDIRMQVFFTCVTTKLVNKSDYIEVGIHADKWKGVDILEYRDMSGYYFKDPGENIITPYDEGLDSEMLSMLSSSLSATGLMFSEMFHKDKLVEHSQGKLRNLAKKLEIFA